MDGSVAKVFGYLREVHAVRPYHFLGCIDLHLRKILDNAESASLLEDFLQLRTADEVIAADLFYRHV